MAIKKATVIIATYPETRRRINVHCAAKGLSQPEYLDTIVPGVPGDNLAGDGNAPAG